MVLKSQIPATTLVTCLLLFTGGAGRAESFAHYEVIAQRNIFRPLWDLKGGDSSTPGMSRGSSAEQERQQLETKRADLERSLCLNGIVYDGKHNYAIITNRSTGAGGNYQTGDTLAGARITAINEQDKTAVLDYAGKFTITLKVGIGQ